MVKLRQTLERVLVILQTRWRSTTPEMRWAVLIAFGLGLLGQGTLGRVADSFEDLAEWVKGKGPEKRIAVRSDFVTAQDIVPTFRTFATLEPQTEAILRPPPQTVVSEVLVRVGETVKQGQVLVKFRSDAASLRSDLEQLELSRKEMDIELTLALAKKDFVSKREEQMGSLDKKATRLRRTLSELDGGMSLRSPIAGVVGEMGLAPGDFMDQVQLHTVRVINPNGYRVQLSVPKRVAEKLKPGREATLHMVDEDPLETGDVPSMVARVGSIGRSLDSKTGSVYLDLFATSDKPWMPGSPIEVEIPLENGVGIAAVPVDSVIWENGKAFIFEIVEVDSGSQKGRFLASSWIPGGASEEVARVRKAQIEVGLRDDRYLEVKSGLEEGAQIVIRGGSALRDGSLIEVRNSDAAGP